MFSEVSVSLSDHKGGGVGWYLWSRVGTVWDHKGGGVGWYLWSRVLSGTGSLWGERKGEYSGVSTWG